MAALSTGRARLVRHRPDGVVEDFDYPSADQPLAVDSSGRVLLRRTLSGPGLYLWEGDAARQLLALNSPAPDGGRIAAFVNAGFDAAGDVLDRTIPPFLTTTGLVRGGTWPRFQTGMRTLAEAGPAGIATRLNLGDPLPDGTLFNGAGLYLDGGSMGLYFASGTRLFRRVDGRVEVVATAGGGIGNFAVNTRGQAVMVSGQRLYLYDGASVNLIADNTTRAPSGGAFSSWNQVAIDDPGRVLAGGATTELRSGLFLYDGVWQTKLLLNDTRIRGTVVTSYAPIRAAGRRFYSLVLGLGFSALASFQDSDWEVEAAYGDPLPASAELIGSVSTLYDVNARGEMLLRVSGPGRTYLVVKSAAGIKPILNNAMPAEGSYINLNAVQSMILQDDGTVYLAGFDQTMRYLIVRADPL